MGGSRRLSHTGLGSGALEGKLRDNTTHGAAGRGLAAYFGFCPRLTDEIANLNRRRCCVKRQQSTDLGAASQVIGGSKHVE
jgi:hypothetical protein